MKRCMSILLLATAAQLAAAGASDVDDPISATYADHGTGGNGDAREGVRYIGSGGADKHLWFRNDLCGNLLEVALTPADGTMECSVSPLRAQAGPGRFVFQIDRSRIAVQPYRWTDKLGATP